MGRAALVALIVLLMAVTPLSAFLSGGRHETWLPGYGSQARTRVVLLDHTGLVGAISPGDSRAESSPKTLSVTWHACGGGSTLTFGPYEGGFEVADQEFSSCWFGSWRALAIHLRTPIDPALVTVVDD